MTRQYTAQVCLNGHHTTSRFESSPEYHSKFCPDCGAETITKCPNCNSNIKGKVEYDSVVFIGEGYTPPSFCYACGTAFPWMQSAIDSAVELAQLSDALSVSEIALFQTDLKDLSVESPKTQVAIVRTKALLGKVGKEIGSGLKSIIIEIASEAAKKAMGL